MGLLSLFLKFYENTRPTTSNKPSIKPEKRNYDFDSGLTGIKCEDLKLTNTIKKKQESSKEKNNYREER